MDETRNCVEDQLDQCRRALSWKPCLDAETRALLSAANANHRALRQKRQFRLGFLRTAASQRRLTASVERLRARVVSVMEDARHNADALFEESQAHDLIDKLLRSRAPCIAVQGDTGTGKTTLGLQICASWLLVPKLLEKYPHGPHMIEVGASKLAANDANDAHEVQLLKQLSRLYEELKASPEPIEPTLKRPSSMADRSTILAFQRNRQDCKGGSTCATVTAQLQTLCSLICSCLSSQRCLIILDDVSRHQARLITWYLLAADTFEGSLVVTSRSDVSELLLEPERFDTRPSQKLRERVLCSNAYGKGSIQHLKDMNTEDGETILRVCGGNLRLLHAIASVLNQASPDSWRSVKSAVMQMPEDLEATEVESYLCYYQAMDTLTDWRRHVELFVMVVCWFDPTDCLPEAIVYHVWRAVCLQDRRLLYSSETMLTLAEFREVLTALLDAGLLKQVVRVPPYNTAGLLLQSALVRHVRRQQPMELPDLPTTSQDAPSLSRLSHITAIKALCCISLFGNQASAKSATEVLHKAQISEPRSSEGWWASFKARELFMVSIPAAVEALGHAHQHLPSCANEELLQELLFSAATGRDPGAVASQLPELLSRIHTAPFALAIIIGSQALPAKVSWEQMHSDAVRELVASVEAEDVSMPVLDSAEVLEKIWKALFYELNMPGVALPVIHVVAAHRNQVLGSDDDQTRAAKLCVASTLAACGQQAHADDVLRSAHVRSLCPQIAQGYALETQRLLALRDYKGALVCAELSLVLHRELRGDTHPTTFSARRALAWAMHRCGLHERALDQFLEVCARTTQMFGEQHYLSLLSEAEAGVAYEGLSLHQDALQQKEKSLSELERAAGDEHPACVRLKRSTAISLAQLGQMEAAMARDRHVLRTVSSPGELLESMCDVAIDHYLAAHVQLSRWPPQLDQAFGNLRKSERMLRMASVMATELEHSCNSIPDQLQAVKHLKLVYVLFCVRHMHLWHSQHGGCPTPELYTSSSVGEGASFPARTARSWLGQSGSDQTAVTAHLESVPVMTKPERPFQPLLHAMNGPDVPEQPGEHCLSTLHALLARDGQERAIKEWKAALIQCVRRQVATPKGELGSKNLPGRMPASEERQIDVTQNFLRSPRAGNTLAFVLLAHSRAWRGLLADGSDARQAKCAMDVHSPRQGISRMETYMRSPAVLKMVETVDFVREVLRFWRRLRRIWEDGSDVQMDFARELGLGCFLLQAIQIRASNWRSGMEHLLVDEAREIIQAATLHYYKRDRSSLSMDLLCAHQNQVTLEHLCKRFSLRVCLLDSITCGSATGLYRLDDSVVHAIQRKCVWAARCVLTWQAIMEALSNPQATPSDVVPLLHQLDSAVLDVQLLSLDPMHKRRERMLHAVLWSISKVCTAGRKVNFHLRKVLLCKHSKDFHDERRAGETRLGKRFGESDQNVHDGGTTDTVGAQQSIRVRCPVTRRGYALLGQCAPVRMHPCGHVVSSAAAESTPAKCPLCGVKTVTRRTDPDVHTLRLLQVLPEIYEVPAVMRSRKALRGDASGRVFLGKYEGQDVAVKVVNVDYRSSESLFRAAQLVAITQLSSGTSRVFQKLLAVSWTARGPELVLQLCDSSLQKVMKEAGGSLPPGDVVLLLVELLSAVLALHNRTGIAHGHIRPDSVLVQQKRICLISCGVSVNETLHGVHHAGAVGAGLPTSSKGGMPDASKDIHDIAATALFAASGVESYGCFASLLLCPSDDLGCSGLLVPDFLPQPLQQLLQRMVEPEVDRRPSLQAAHRDALFVFNNLATPPRWLQFVYTHSVQLRPVHAHVHPTDHAAATRDSNGWFRKLFGPGSAMDCRLVLSDGVANGPCPAGTQLFELHAVTTVVAFTIVMHAVTVLMLFYPFVLLWSHETDSVVLEINEPAVVQLAPQPPVCVGTEEKACGLKVVKFAANAKFVMTAISIGLYCAAYTLFPWWGAKYRRRPRGGAGSVSTRDCKLRSHREDVHAAHRDIIHSMAASILSAIQVDLLLLETSAVVEINEPAVVQLPPQPPMRVCTDEMACDLKDVKFAANAKSVVAAILIGLDCAAYTLLLWCGAKYGRRSRGGVGPVSIRDCKLQSRREDVHAATRSAWHGGVFEAWTDLIRAVKALGGQAKPETVTLLDGSTPLLDGSTKSGGLMEAPNPAVSSKPGQIKSETVKALDGSTKSETVKLFDEFMYHVEIARKSLRLPSCAAPVAQELSQLITCRGSEGDKYKGFVHVDGSLYAWNAAAKLQRIAFHAQQLLLLLVACVAPVTVLVQSEAQMQDVASRTGSSSTVTRHLKLLCAFFAMMVSRPSAADVDYTLRELQRTNVQFREPEIQKLQQTYCDIQNKWWPSQSTLTLTASLSGLSRCAEALRSNVQCIVDLVRKEAVDMEAADIVQVLEQMEEEDDDLGMLARRLLHSPNPADFCDFLLKCTLAAQHGRVKMSFCFAANKPFSRLGSCTPIKLPCGCTVAYLKAFESRSTGVCCMCHHRFSDTRFRLNVDTAMQQIVQLSAYGLQMWVCFPPESIQLGHKLGQGSQATVYAATLFRREQQPGEDVAVKEFPLRPPMSTRRPSSKAALYHSITTTLLASVNPHVCQVHGVSWSDDSLWLVMEKCESSLPLFVDLVGDCTGVAGLPQIDVLVLGWMLLDALGTVHDYAKSLHLDIKPDNVMLEPMKPGQQYLSRRTIKLIDFGLGVPLATHASAISPTWNVDNPRGWTRAYSPPEQMNLINTQPASDVYAVGATMLFAATAQRPYGTHTTAQGVFENHAKGIPMPVAKYTPEGLRYLISDMTQMLPDRRPTRFEAQRRIVRMYLQLERQGEVAQYLAPHWGMPTTEPMDITDC